MFENKAFYIEMIDKRESDPTQPRNPDKYKENLTYTAVVVVGVLAAAVGLKTISEVIVNTTKSK